MNYIVFDLEFNKPKGQPMVINNTKLTSEILQIGAVMLDEDLNELDCMDIRGKPKYYTVLDSGVAGITHLCQRDMEYGMGFQEAYEVNRH